MARSRSGDFAEAQHATSDDERHSLLDRTTVHRQAKFPPFPFYAFGFGGHFGVSPIPAVGPSMWWGKSAPT